MSSPRSFCTSILKTSDPDRAARFYTSLLHTFFQSGGKTVASMQTSASGRDACVPHVCVCVLERTTEAAPVPTV